MSADRIAGAFGHGRAAFMPYLMGGFPNVQASVDVGRAYAAGGADLVELGVPYSDPLADGPVIHAAGTMALRAGATPKAVLEVGEQLAAEVPVVLMCYANLILARGFDAFAQTLGNAGISGLIVPDLPVHEADAAITACDAAGVALVPLVAPTTEDARLRLVGERARGFVYTVSSMGTTGERTSLDARYADVVRRTKAVTPVPVALGFGISTPEQGRAAADAGADGVIVGTRLVRAVADGEDVEGIVRSFSAALR